LFDSVGPWEHELVIASQTKQRWWCANVGVLALALLSGCGDDKSDPDQSAGGNGNGGNGDRAGNGGNGSHAGSSSASAGKTGGGGTVTPIGGGKSSAADIARKLGREPNFLIGMGNDLPSTYVWENSGIYTLGSQLDLHYIYLAKGWQDWNEGGYFPQIIAKVDMAKNTTPMSTVYAIAGNGENNFATLVDDDYMSQYWTTAKLLMQRYAELDTPALVHLEPDFWAYAQQKSGGDPATVPAHLAPDCTDLPADVSGMARCWVKLARDNAPKVVVGLHASEWGGGSGDDVGAFLNKLGVAEADVVVIDMLDRDAGCFEDGKLAQCMRGGSFYLDETNKSSPNYDERLAFAKQVSTTTGKPILWWQLPFGVPSDTPGGTPGHFRDNKVHYLFSHVREFVDAGGVGATFGTGAGDQTSVDTDGGQFKDAVKAYTAAPVPLP
jgi:hypothetical protein